MGPLEPASRNRNWTGVSSDTRMAIGLSCLLCFTTCSITGQIEQFSGMVHFEPGYFLACSVLAIMMMAGVHAFRSSLTRRAFTAAALLLALVWTGSAVAMLFSPSCSVSPLVHIFGSAGRMASVIMTVQWHLHMSLCNERNAARLTSIALVSSVSLYIAICAIGSSAALLILCALLLASSCLLALAELELEDKTLAAFDVSQSLAEPDFPEKGESMRSNRAKFFGSRVAWGLAFGILMTIVTPFPAPQVSNPMAIPISAVSLCLAVLASRKWPESTSSISALAFFPLALLGLLGFCFFQKTPEHLIRLAAALAFLSWSAQMYYQLPSYRKLLKLSPAPYAYADKLSSFIVFESAVWLALESGLVETIANSQPHAVLVAAAWGTLTVLALSTYVTARHFVGFYPTESNESPEQPLGSPQAKSHFDQVQEIAQKCRLTEREADVLRLLAEGYSRPYIQKALFISEGTVKTHSLNIYRKLGVSTRDQLIELVKSVSQTE